MSLYGAEGESANESALAQIERDRDEASRRLTRTRDLAAWQSAMAKLDTEERLAREPMGQRGLSPPEVVGYLRSLGSLWADTEASGRQALATALFACIEVLGYRQMAYELTGDAIALGLDVVLPAVLELNGPIAEFGRGERIRGDTIQLSVRIVGGGSGASRIGRIA